LQLKYSLVKIQFNYKIYFLWFQSFSEIIILCQSLETKRLSTVQWYMNTFSQCLVWEVERFEEGVRHFYDIFPDYCLFAFSGREFKPRCQWAVRFAQLAKTLHRSRWVKSTLTDHKTNFYNFLRFKFGLKTDFQSYYFLKFTKKVLFYKLQYFLIF